MGLGSDVIQLLFALREQGALPTEKSVIEIGAQQLANNFLESRNELALLGLQFGVTEPCPLVAEVQNQEIIHGNLEHQSHDAPAAKAFWEWLGYKIWINRR